MERTRKLSPLAFLRTLQASRASVISLAEDLKAHGLTEHPGPLPSSTVMLIDQNVEELFVPYLQDRGYMESEKEGIEQLYTGLLLKFNMFHVRLTLGLGPVFKVAKLSFPAGPAEKRAESRSARPIQEDARASHGESPGE